MIKSRKSPEKVVVCQLFLIGCILMCLNDMIYIAPSFVKEALMTAPYIQNVLSDWLP